VCLLRPRLIHRALGDLPSAGRHRAAADRVIVRRPDLANIIRNRSSDRAAAECHGRAWVARRSRIDIPEPAPGWHLRSHTRIHRVFVRSGQCFHPLSSKGERQDRFHASDVILLSCGKRKIWHMVKFRGMVSAVSAAAGIDEAT
jgi:hypothetical protein